MSKARDSVEDLKTLDANLAAKLPKSGGALTGAVTTNSTFDGVDIATRDAVLTSTTTTANAALPKAGGAVTGNVTFGDNNKAIFGAGSDLQIYHDGSNSYISDQGTNDLKILATDFQLKNAADNEFMITGVTDGAVTLYQNNAAKIATTSGGVAITGSATATTFQANAGGTFTTESGNDLNIVYPEGRSLFVKEAGTTHLTVDNVGTLIVGGTTKVSHGQSIPFQAGEGGNFFTIQRNDGQDVLEVNTKTDTAVTRTHFALNNSNGTVGTIQTQGSGVAYNTSSDHRLKENVDYNWDATTRLKQLKPARFNFIADADTTVDGVTTTKAEHEAAYTASELAKVAAAEDF